MNKFAIKTLGCKVNTYESEVIKAKFLEEGFIEVDFDTKADIYVINTCTVTNASDVKSRKMLRRAHKTNPDAIVCAVGCYAQIKPEEVAKIEGIDIIIGSNDKGNIINLIKEYQAENKQINIVEDIFQNDTFDSMEVETYSDKTRAFIKIQDGCNYFCTYCIIPYARGKVRSKKPEALLKEVKQLSDNGFKEIILTGIHTGGYGQDLDNYSFLDLLKDIEKHAPKLDRVRISSIEINQLTTEVIDHIANSKVVVNHLHIPIQSGSDRILKLMKRHYTLSEFKAKIKEIRSKLVDCSITTDIIIGFPTETDKDFEEVLNTLKEIRFADMHIFPYSAREGTPAAAMEQLNGTIKDARVAKVIELNEQIKKEYDQSFDGKVMPVLFETVKNNQANGHTRNYLKVFVDTDKNLTNQILDVKIIKTENGIKGELV